MSFKKAKSRAKVKTMFSLKSYLQKKAVKKAEKLQYREAKRSGALSQAQPPELHEHVHGPDCDHDHEHEDLVVEEEQA